MRKTVALAVLGVALAAGSGFAQQKAPQGGPFPDWRADPRYGTLNLRADFQPDPREVSVEAGGDRQADGIGPGCAGWIDFSRPDVDVNYEAGSFPLIISAVSSADTTIVVNDPSGRWLCNDDFQGLNPGVVFERPQSGNYNIWVGTFDRGRPQPATVRISEIMPQGR